MSILTPEAKVMCDAALEAGIAPPTHEDPVVCEKQLYYLALSVGTPVHALIRRLVFNENIQVFTQWVCEKLSKRACVYVAICAAKSVLELIPADEARPRQAIDSACKWLQDPSAYTASAASAASADAAASRTPKDHWSRTIDFHSLVLESAIFAAKEYP